MSISITLTCLFALIHFHCAIENKNDSNELSTEINDSKSDEDQEVLTKSLTTRELKDDMRNDGKYPHDEENQVTRNIVYIDADEIDDGITMLSTNPAYPFLRVTLKSTAQPAGLGTDVIFRLQEKLRNLANPRHDKYIPVPEAWPVITLNVPRLTPPPHITPPLRTTRSFLDHFKTLKFNFRQSWTKFSGKLNVSQSNIAVTTRDEQLESFVLTHHPLISPLYDHKRSVTLPKTQIFEDTENWWEYNPRFKDIKDIKWMRPSAITPIFPILRQGITTTTNITTNTTTTTTTTTRTTRTYPYPNWICYECGKNETKYGSSVCHDIFEVDGNPQNYRKYDLHYKCNGDKSVVYQCYKRFLDIGDYNERGCRDWPPRKSGRTFVSKRLRALEKVLKGVTDGCVFSPNAALVPFSESVQLYARFHVCVCKGKLCNIAATDGPSSAVFFVMIVAFYV